MHLSLEAHSRCSKNICWVNPKTQKAQETSIIIICSQTLSLQAESSCHQRYGVTYRGRCLCRLLCDAVTLAMAVPAPHSWRPIQGDSTSALAGSQSSWRASQERDPAREQEASCGVGRAGAQGFTSRKGRAVREAGGDLAVIFEGHLLGC